MNSPRVRRLLGDYGRLTARFSEWPLIQVEATQGQPPDAYRVTYHLRGLYTDEAGVIRERAEHVLEVGLSLEYPRRAPSLRLLTPIFHPNFNRGDVCAQDIYAASEGLDDLVIRVGRMIAYQQYNIKSPLNGIAAKWAEQNSAKLPVDSREVSPPTIHEVPRAPSTRKQPAVVDERKVSSVRYQALEQDRDSNARCSFCGNSIQADGHSNVAWCPYCNKTVPLERDGNQKDEDDETTKVICPHCEQHLEVDTNMIGEVVECPSCTKLIVLK